MSVTSAAAVAAIGGLIVEEVLEDIEELLDQVLDSISQTVSNLAQDLIAQAKIAFEEVYGRVKRDLDKTIAQLTADLQVAVYGLKLMAEDLLEQAASNFEDVSEEAIRDFRELLSSTWAYTEFFKLDEINGTLIPAHLTGDAEISVTGLNVGFDSDDIESKLSVTLYPVGVPPMRINELEVSDSEARFIIPSSFIEAHRRERDVALIKAVLDIRATKDRLLFDKKYKSKQPFMLTLAPQVAGSLSAAAKEPVFEWVKDDTLNVIFKTHGPNGHFTTTPRIRPQHRHHTIKVSSQLHSPPRENDRRCYKVDLNACIPRHHDSGCPFTNIHRAQPANGGRDVSIHTENWSRPVDFEFKARIEQYRQTSEVSHDIPATDIKSGEIISISGPAKSKSVRFFGSDLDFGVIDLVSEIREGVPMLPTGRDGGLQFISSDVGLSEIVYRFQRRS